MNLLLFLALSLATWRISSMLVNESGPANVFRRVRNGLGVIPGEKPENQPHILAGIFACLWCNSVWVGWLLGGLTIYGLGEKLTAVTALVVLGGGLSLSTTAIIIEIAVNQIEAGITLLKALRALAEVAEIHLTYRNEALENDD